MNDPKQESVYKVRERWAKGCGRGSPEERQARWRTVQRLLRETHSVQETAILLGVPAYQLSRWLNAVSRVEWWRAEKRRWSRRARAARQARWRSRKLQGLV